MPSKKTKDALKLIKRDVGVDPSFRALVDQEKLNAQIARMIYEARTQAKLTQKQLGVLVGTTQPAIARLEDAEYGGHSLTMLWRTADALDRRLEIRFVARRWVDQKTCDGT